MLHFRLRYLTGCVAATDVADRREVEWPPHPGRVFLALASAHFEGAADPDERAALEWLERQPAPLLHAGDASRREPVTAFVPVNDRAAPSRTPINGFSGWSRDRHPRCFARAHLASEYAALYWPDVCPDPHLPALRRLGARVSRLGHSSSLVQLDCPDAPPNTPPAWVPDEAEARAWFRMPHPGLLRDLRQRYDAAHPGAPAADDEDADIPESPDPEDASPAARRHPELPRVAGYRPLAEPAPPEHDTSSTLFDPRLVVLALRPENGGVLDPAALLRLTRRLRCAFLACIGSEPASEHLTGHRGSGPAVLPHVAFLGIPDPGRSLLVGAALVLPRDLIPEERRRVLECIARLRQDGLCLGSLGRWQLLPLDPGSPACLWPRTWTRFPTGARRWGTVTPFVLDRHSSARDIARYRDEIAAGVRWSCTRIGLPEPDTVAFGRVSHHAGAPAAHEFPRLRRKDGTEQRQIHVGLTFPRPVVGPLLLGAGRFRGYGLCQALPDEP